MADADREGLDRFDVYLDAQAEAARRHARAEPPTGDLDPVLPETVRCLRALDAANAPDPALANQLWEELMNQLGLAGAVPLTTTGAVPAFNGRAAPRPWRAYLPSLPVSKHRRRWAMAQFATALLVLIALLAIYVAFRPTDEKAVVPVEVSPTAIPAPNPSGSVPTYRGDFARTGINPGPGPQGKPVVRWQVDTESMLWGSPAVVDGVVYASGNGGVLLALDAATGRERWRFEQPSFSDASPTVVDGVVYAGFYDGKLRALDAATGAVRWEFDAGRVIPDTPAVVDGVVYFGTGIESSPGDLIAVEAATGHERWRIPLDASAFAFPAVVDGVVYVGTGKPNASNGTVYAVDATTGAQRWTFATGYDFGGVTVVGGVLYVGAEDGVYAIDAATGTERWHMATERVYTDLAVVDGIVYALGDGGNLVALDAATGAERWRVDIGGTSNPVSSPTVAAGVVYVASDGPVLHAIDAAIGTERWQLSLPPAEEWAEPTVVDGVIYLGTGGMSVANGVLYALGDALPATPAP